MPPFTRNAMPSLFDRDEQEMFDEALHVIDPSAIRVLQEELFQPATALREAWDAFWAEFRGTTHYVDGPDEHDSLEDFE